jgi:hypothetical protein
VPQLVDGPVETPIGRIVDPASGFSPASNSRAVAEYCADEVVGLVPAANPLLANRASASSNADANNENARRSIEQPQGLMGSACKERNENFGGSARLYLISPQAKHKSAFSYGAVG